MVNNIGTTTKKLNPELGRTTEFELENDIEILTGELGLGCLIFDEAGTIGVVSELAEELSTFMVTTYALSIDIETILSLSY